MTQSPGTFDAYKVELTSADGGPNKETVWIAKDLRIPLDLGEAVRNLVTGRPARVDVGEVNGHIFINNSSLGIYPKLVRERERKQRQGMSKWPAFLIALITVLRRYPLVGVRLVADDQELVRRTPFVFVGNNEYKVEGINLGARTQLDAGLMFAYLAPRVHTRDLPKLLTHALLGRARQDGHLQVVPAAELWIETLYVRDVTIACDGELLIVRPPFHFRSWPGSLGVMVPA